MLFNSLAFLIFFALVLLVYPRLGQRAQNRFLLAASYLFYGWWDWRFLALLATSTLIDYGVGRGLGGARSPRRRRWLLGASLAGNLGLLGVFKYYDFFAASAAALLESWGLAPNLPLLRVVLPVGISFYTFQTLSYTLDVYRGRLAPCRDLLDFALFVSFFPQLVAGPIERAGNLLPQVQGARRVTRQQVEAGLALMLIGYVKKVALADTLAPIVDHCFAAPGACGSGELLAGAYAFCLQIYGDFSGYSDIARGAARLLGFELMVNFRAPYLSRSPAEYWRRWHISLSTWLRDYLYIPLGGNRKGTARAHLNIMATMLLGGLWHGAGWTFAAWGALNGLYLVGYKLLGGRRPELAWPREPAARLRDLGKLLLTFHLIVVVKILFRSPDFATFAQYLHGIVMGAGWSSFGPPHVLLAGAAMLALDLLQERQNGDEWLARLPRPWRLGVAPLLTAVVVAAAVFRLYRNPPFIYFRF